MSGRELEEQLKSSAPGEILEKTREELGITQREVADALNLPLVTVIAIEADDKEQLPAHVFTRGYVRAYAKLLEIDPDPLVAALTGASAEDDQLAIQDNATENLAVKPPIMNLSAPVWQKLMQPKALGVAGTFLIVVVVGVWWMTSNGATEPDEANLVALDQEFVTQDDAALTDQNGAAAVVSQTAQTIELAAQERADEVQESPPSTIIEPVKQEPAQSEPADSVARSDEDAESTVAMVQPPVAVPGQRRLTETGDDVLRLSFSEECWVEIKTTDGQLLFGDLGKAGQQREFVGAAPFKVLLGYAPGAMLEFNEEPVALSPHTRNNVASLVLGQ